MVTRCNGQSGCHALSIAPMIQWTDRHWRFMMRQVTKQTLLYTEMTMDNTILHNIANLEDFIGHDSIEYPLSIQLGGNDPATLSEAAYLCESYGAFHEINLNAGCPSNKAKRAGFGAELMLEPDLVRQIVYAMCRKVAHTTVTVKCRLGVTPDRDSVQDLLEFVEAVRQGGVRRMIIHARNCVLRGLSPAQNRTIPPLHYDIVHDLVARYPDMEFVLNGGIVCFEDAHYHMGNRLLSREEQSRVHESPMFENPVHGVMIGREAYRNPFMFATADQQFFASPPQRITRREVLHAYLDYAISAQDRDLYDSGTHNLLKPLHNFCTGCENNHMYKRKLDQIVHSTKTVPKVGMNMNSKNLRKEIPIDEIVYMAIEDSIPSSFLDEELGGVD